MSLQIAEPIGPTSADEISRTEDSLGVTFPETYRVFLRRTGGGSTDDLTVPGTGGDGVLHELYGTADLLKWHVDYGRSFGFLGYIPQQYLMIGGGSGGAPCLRTSGGDEGSVWWADFDKAGAIPEEEPSEDIMIRLADDFDTFLNLFQ